MIRNQYPHPIYLISFPIKNEKKNYSLYSSQQKGMTKIKVKEVLKGIEPLAMDIKQAYQTKKDKNNWYINCLILSQLIYKKLNCYKLQK